MNPLLNGMNKQAEAVKQLKVRVMAGAGSGKPCVDTSNRLFD